jgi:serine/threonine protein kinase
VSCDREAAVANVQPLTDGDPRRLGDYDVTGRLGEGGQGVVYLGRGTGGLVAVKLLHAQLIEDEAARARFVREVEVTKRVARFCTAQVLSAGTAAGRPYIVSEYVTGPSLHRQLREEGPRRGSALDRLAINTATALAAIHQAGVVHRDFKPGNVLMGPDGPVVIDFGIARALDATGMMTGAVSQVVGTPAFMAPEQLADGVIGPHTDMFAWAITMVYAASGVPAFGHRSIPQVMNRILHDEPDLGELDGRLRPAVAACLTKDPTRRPTARDLMDELMGRHMPPPPSVATEQPPSRPTKNTNAPETRTAGPPSPHADSGPRGTSDSQTPRMPGAAPPYGGTSVSPMSAGPGTPPPGAVPPYGGTSVSPMSAGSGTTPPPGAVPPYGGRSVSPMPAGPGTPPPGATPRVAGTVRLPAATSQQGPSTDGEGQTARLPRMAATSGADASGSHGPVDAGTARLPASGSFPSGGPPGQAGSFPSGGPPGQAGFSGLAEAPPGPPERRKGRTALIIGAVAAVLIALIAGISALAASGHEKDKPAAAPPSPAKQAHRPSRHRTPPPSRTPSRTPSRRPVAAKPVRANPYTPQKLCGAGYGVVDTHALGQARTYLLYNNRAGTNCVVTMVPRSNGKVPLTASLVVQGGQRASRSGAFPFYAGPIRLPARGKCVMWGGASKTAKWTSGWSHCGK